MRPCEVDGCEREHKAKGLCQKHYTASWYAANRGKAAAGSAEWRIANLARNASNQARWRAEHPGYSAAQHRLRMAANPGAAEGQRVAALLGQYGLTLAEYDALLARQGGGCALCGAAASHDGRRLAVDHDHACCPGKGSCGKCVRGLLCSHCNRALGLLNDDPARLLRGHAYLSAKAVNDDAARRLAS